MLVAVYPPEPSSELSEALLVGGIDTTQIVENTVSHEWEIAVVELSDDAGPTLRKAREMVEDLGVPVLAVVDRSLANLLAQAEFITDFIFAPPDPLELKLRLSRLTQEESVDEIVAFKDLELNTATYQATISGRPIDLTYMEYELLRFFIEHPGRVWSREQLLSKVWGYDYFGGARTVDVHVRRLRFKLGEERASWITTVRSVGYRFG